MSATENFIAIDFGASNGRAIAGLFDGNRIRFSEIHRFENRPVYMGGVLYWNFLSLFSELKTGIANSSKKYRDIESIGIDTWGCDFGLLDKNNILLSNPVHYRDRRTIGISAEVKNYFSEYEMYERTQAQILEINTVCQLYSLKKSKSVILENANRLLFLGDLFNFFLTGQVLCEFSSASLTQLFNQREKKWEYFIIKKLGLPEHIFTETTEPGIVIGKLNSNITEDLNCPGFNVVLTGYDTTSEITAIPVSACDSLKNWAYLNCGTWAMVGVVSDGPIVTAEGFKHGFGNEGGFGGKYHFLKNMVGLYIIQQCRNKWNENNNLSWKDIDSYTEKTASTDIFIDVDDIIFEREIFDMPWCIIKYCESTRQKTPEDIGQICRIFYESLVLKYILNLKKLEKILGKKIELLHIVGGGSNNSILSQWISDASGLLLIAGPKETTATGNILAQMVAVKAAGDIKQAREILISSVKLNNFLPDKTQKSYWDNKFEKYLKVLSLEI
ncbi:MAG: rhamnulokinase [Actinobacteria bacterium]|nr:rhamnulokinase [Actinomycetota bacterium]